MLTQERLRELLDYDPETGVFTWRVSRRGAKKGCVAGSLSHGYIHIRVDEKPYRAHRLAWLYMHGYFPENQIDHINRVRDDNRIINLREVSIQCNARNRGVRSTNTSGVVGVYWYKAIKKWRVQIKADGKNLHLGYYRNLPDAVLSRWNAEVKHEFPNCNSDSSAYQYLIDNKIIRP